MLLVAWKLLLWTLHRVYRVMGLSNTKVRENLVTNQPCVCCVYREGQKRGIPEQQGIE